MLTMSNLTKAQAAHQFAWCTCRTSLGADGIPGKFIEEDLQQLYRIEISFEEGSKDIKINLKKLQTYQVDFRHRYGACMGGPKTLKKLHF
jgi:hypothetical protein